MNGPTHNFCVNNIVKFITSLITDRQFWLNGVLGAILGFLFGIMFHGIYEPNGVELLQQYTATHPEFYRLSSGEQSAINQSLQMANAGRASSWGAIGAIMVSMSLVTLGVIFSRRHDDSSNENLLAESNLVNPGYFISWVISEVPRLFLIYIFVGSIFLAGKSNAITNIQLTIPLVILVAYLFRSVKRIFWIGYGVQRVYENSGELKNWILKALGFSIDADLSKKTVHLRVDGKHWWDYFQPGSPGGKFDKVVPLKDFRFSYVQQEKIKTRTIYAFGSASAYVNNVLITAYASTPVGSVTRTDKLDRYDLTFHWKNLPDASDETSSVIVRRIPGATIERLDRLWKYFEKS